MPKEYYVFRQPRSVDELEELIRLRYRVYRNSRMQKFEPKATFGLNISNDDLRAHHFGLFLNDTKAIGYHRQVGEFLSPQFTQVIELAEQYPDCMERLQKAPSYPLPILNYWPEHDKIVTYYKSLKAQGKKVEEPTRFSLDPSYCSLELAKHIACHHNIHVSGFPRCGLQRLRSSLDLPT